MTRTRKAQPRADPLSQTAMATCGRASACFSPLERWLPASGIPARSAHRCEPPHDAGPCATAAGRARARRSPARGIRRAAARAPGSAPAPSHWRGDDRGSGSHPRAVTRGRPAEPATALAASPDHPKPGHALRSFANTASYPQDNRDAPVPGVTLGASEHTEAGPVRRDRSTETRRPNRATAIPGAVWPARGAGARFGGHMRGTVGAASRRRPGSLGRRSRRRLPVGFEDGLASTARTFANVEDRRYVGAAPPRLWPSTGLDGACGRDGDANEVAGQSTDWHFEPAYTVDLFAQTR
jgi:hypothetical protein